jgi:hypothetical protein
VSTYLDRFAEIAKRLVSSKGGEALHGLSPELLLAVVLEADRPEFQALGGTRLIAFNSGVLAAGGAGTSNQVALSSGTGAILTVVTHVLVGAQTARMGLSAITGATGPVTNGVTYRDNRLRGNPATLLYTKNSVVQLLGSQRWIRLPASVWTAIPGYVQVAVGSNTLIVIENETTNQALEVIGLGYERVIDAAESHSSVS